MTASLAGLRIMVIEDEFLIADDLAQTLVELGATVVGPASDVETAMDILEKGTAPDFAVLDLNLAGELSFAVADALLEREIPFVFTSGYDQTAIPQRYDGIFLCGKPVDTQHLVDVLLGSRQRTRVFSSGC